MKISDSTLNKIIKESVKKVIKEYDEGEFTPIHSQMSLKAFEKDDKQALELQRKKNTLKAAVNKIASDTFSNMHYLKSVANVLNPMFINQIDDKNEKKLAEIAHDLYVKYSEFFEYVNNIKNKI